jgi:hypothetical protein
VVGALYVSLAHVRHFTIAVTSQNASRIHVLVTFVFCLPDFAPFRALTFETVTQLAVLRGCPDAGTDDKTNLHYRLEMVGACASMWLASTVQPTREKPVIMDRLLMMIDKASDVYALVYYMPALWLMARSDYNREYLVRAELLFRRTK